MWHWISVIGVCLTRYLSRSTYPFRVISHIRICFSVPKDEKLLPRLNINNSFSFSLLAKSNEALKSIHLQEKKNIYYYGVIRSTHDIYWNFNSTKSIFFSFYYGSEQQKLPYNNITLVECVYPFLYLQLGNELHCSQRIIDSANLLYK